jgi:hypothetical protein
LESQERTLSQGFETGALTEARAAAANFLTTMGVKDAEKYATNAQTFRAAANEVILQKQLAQKGPQTESDAKRMAETAALLENTPKANQFIIDVARTQNARDIAQQRFYDNYWRQNKTYEGADEAWFSGEGGRSLFEQPRLKKYDATVKPRPAVKGSGTTIKPSLNYSDPGKERRYQEWKRSQGK